ncbi:MAG: hypothetical protein YK1309IOTA_850003 [Marine Group I thaumarchaeote]|nr:MAG: hypothetical protein YK1309IOTA_850003 [Marine Group I thaumarchaeote]
MTQLNIDNEHEHHSRNLEQRISILSDIEISLQGKITKLEKTNQEHDGTLSEKNLIIHELEQEKIVLEAITDLLEKKKSELETIRKKR